MNMIDQYIVEKGGERCVDLAGIWAALGWSATWAGLQPGLGSEHWVSNQ